MREMQVSGADNHPSGGVGWGGTRLKAQPVTSTSTSGADGANKTEIIRTTESIKVRDITPIYQYTDTVA